MGSISTPENRIWCNGKKKLDGDSGDLNTPLMYPGKVEFLPRFWREKLNNS
jgi:hypothetical protein